MKIRSGPGWAVALITHNLPTGGGYSSFERGLADTILEAFR
jgi:hypothetical protein